MFLNENDVECFVAILDCKTITKASETLCISQPSLSQRLAKMERDLGVRLFDRKQSKMILTPAGEKYMEYINRSRDLEQQLQNSFAEIRDNDQGVLQIGAPLWKGNQMLPTLMKKLIEKYPDIDCKIYESSSTKLAQMLLAGKIDLSIINEAIHEPSLQQEHLVTENLFLVCRNDHPLAKGMTTSVKYPASINLDQLRQERFILPSKDLYLSELVDDFFSSKKFTPRRVIELKNISTVLELALAGIGFAFVPQMVIESNSASEALAFFHINGFVADWQVSISYKKGHYLSDAAKDFISMVKSFFSVGVLQ